MSTFPLPIDLGIAKRLKESEEFRKEWYRADLEVSVPTLFRSLRERRDFKQSVLAEKTQMKQSAISRFEGSTDAKWKIETLLVLAAALDAQLTIGLEASEDVISRIERQEALALDDMASAAGQAAKDHRNHTRIDAPLGKSRTTNPTPQLNTNSGNSPWN